MADKNTIKSWFLTGLKPTQAQFWATWDSFWHKDEKIPITQINDIENILNDKADAEALANHLTDENAHEALFATKLGASDVDNQFKIIEIGAFSAPFYSELFIASIYVNYGSPVTVTENEIPLFKAIYTGDKVYERLYGVKGKGKSTYGLGGNITLAFDDLFIIESKLLSTEPIFDNDPNAINVNLGEIPGGDFLAVINATPTPFYDITNPLENWYFTFTDGGLKKIYAFQGDLGIYGDGQLQMLPEDVFLIFDEAVPQPVNPTKTSELLNDGEGTTPFATESYVDNADEAVLQNAKDYADSLVLGLLDDRGNYNPATNSNLYPSTGGSGDLGAILKGDLYTINGLGNGVEALIGTKTVTDGDFIRALVDTPAQTETNWVVTENNFGYVAENASNKVTTVSGNEASNTNYASVKAIVDWATGLFQSWVLGINTIAGTTYQIGLTNYKTKNVFTSATAVALTVPTNAVTAIPIGTRTSYTVKGAGTVTISGAGVTFVQKNLIYPRGYTFFLEKIGIDEWIVDGELVLNPSQAPYLEELIPDTYLPSTTGNFILRGAYFVPGMCNGQIANAIQISGTNVINYCTFINDNEIRVNLTTSATDGNYDVTLNNGISATFVGVLQVINGTVYEPTQNTDWTLTGTSLDVTTAPASPAITVFNSLHNGLWFQELDYTKDFKITFKVKKSPLGFSQPTTDQRFIKLQKVSNNSEVFGVALRVDASPTILRFRSYSVANGLQYAVDVNSLTTLEASFDIFATKTIEFRYIAGVMYLYYDNILEITFTDVVSENLKLSVVLNKHDIADIKYIDLSNTGGALQDRIIGKGVNIGLDTTNFTNSLKTTDNTVQKFAEKVNSFNIDGIYANASGLFNYIKTVKDKLNNTLGTFTTAFQLDGLTWDNINKRLGVSPTLLRETRTILAPATTDDLVLFKPAVAITITAINVTLNGGTSPSVTVNIVKHATRNNAGTDVVTSVAVTGGTSETTGTNLTIASGTVAANEYVRIKTPTVGSAPLSYDITIDYTID